MTYLRNQISSEKLNLLLIKYWLLVSKFGNLVVDCNCNMFWRLIQLIDSEYATQSLVISYRSCIAVFPRKFHKIQIKLKLLLRIWLTQIDQNVVFHSISNLWMMEKINLWNTRYNQGFWNIDVTECNPIDQFIIPMCMKRFPEKSLSIQLNSPFFIQLFILKMLVGGYILFSIWNCAFFYTTSLRTIISLRNM